MAENKKLIEVMGDILNDFMEDFRTGMKVIPLTEIVDEVEKAINSNANQYRSQMLSTITRFSHADAAEFDKILKRFIRISDIGNGNPDGWENILKQNVGRIFEQLAGTTIEGKIEYESLENIT